MNALLDVLHSFNLYITLQDSKNQAEVRQMMNMMKNYKNRLFLANHGKRSIAMDEPSDLEEFIDPSLDEEMLSKLFFSAPNSFFFLPKPMGRGFNSKRGGNFQVEFLILLPFSRMM